MQSSDKKIDRYIYLDGIEDFAVDLFPYKIKDPNNFYFRNHPVGLNPNTFRYKAYWKSFEKHCLEGKWINDNGTWVYLMPKLFFYLNYVLISDKDRNTTHPRLMDNVIIMFTYFLCCEGFSGFDGDDEITCNKYVGRLAKGEKLQDFEKEALEKSTGTKKANGEYKRYVEPWEYLTETYLITNKKDKPLGNPIYDNGYYNGMLLCARATFKALPLDTPVFAEFGWKPIKDITVGEKVYGSDGKLCNVTGVSGKLENLKMYKVTLSDGRQIEACEDHLWKVWNKDFFKSRKVKGSGGGYKTMSTGDMVNNYYNYRVDSRHKARHGEIKMIKDFKYSIPLVESLDFTKKDLPIDPYFLGIWLGDGSSKRPGVTTQDKEIVDYCYKIADEHGLSISINENKNKTCPTYFLSGGLAKKGEPINRSLIDKFKSLNLFGNKHIPEIYKTASTEQRLELLRGLMDSDGSAGQGYAYFSNSNKTLAYDTLDLCRSLGMYVHIKEREGTLNGVKHKINYNVVIKTDRKIFNLSRKHNVHTEHQPKGKFGTGRLSRVKIVGIEDVPNADGCCISVDSYDNTYVTKDYIVTHNSFNVFLGLLLHEWLFSGVRKQSDYKSINNALNFGLAAADTKALARSVSNLDRAYFSFPGQYDFPTKVKGKTVKYWGPFYKNTRGQWRVASGASEVKHIVKTKQGKTLVNGSMVQISPIVANNDKIFTGDRFRLGIIEEGGFVANLKNIFISAQDAFKVGKTTTGSIYVIGTGGDLDKIQDAKEMFEDPESFNIFPIPNYWAKSTTVEKKCGMFVGAYYKAEELKDRGNTKLKEALLDVVIDREEKRAKWSRLEFSKELSFNPIYPKELLRPTTKSPIPQQELAAWRDRLVDDKVMEKTAAIGSFKYRNGKVEFETDLEKTMTPILEWGKDEKLEDQTGAWIIHEFPPAYIPEGLYYVLYDPYTQSGEGTSMQSILIYKHKFKTSGGDQSLQDTVVASYIGRLDTLDRAFEEPIKAALFFNAKVFPEMNSIGFAEFVDRKGYQHMMQFIPKQTLEIIKGSTAASHGRSKYGYGVKVNREMNIWSINRLANWLTIPVRKDEKTGIPTWWNYQNIRDLRLLSEGANFDFENKQDFDAMSALMLLPYLLSYLDDYVVELQSEEEAYEKEYERYSLLAKAKREKGVLRSKLSETI